MMRQSANDFDQELLILFDAYVHGKLDRRDFLQAAQKFAFGGATAAGLLAALSPDFAIGQVIAKEDSRISNQWVEYSSPKGSARMRGYLVRPAGTPGPLPAVLVAHENRGLNPHIEDIARRLALAGYMAFAPDALTPLGGYPGDEDKARQMFAQLDQTKTLEDFVAAAELLVGRSDCTGKMGVVGFCWGGGMAHRLAARLSILAAAVPFYGDSPAAAEAAKVKAPLLLHFADIDDRINKAWPSYEEALKAAGVSIAVHHYPGTQHGFNNDTTPRYNATAAAQAWERTLAFFAGRLGSAVHPKA